MVVGALRVHPALLRVALLVLGGGALGYVLFGGFGSLYYSLHCCGGCVAEHSLTSQAEMEK